MTLPLCPSINNSLFLDTNGAVKTCCAGTFDLGNIGKESIPVIFSKKEYLESKQALDEQKFPKYCSRCEDYEKIGPHLSQYDYFKNNIPGTETRQLKHVDLRWSTVCNLSCRYCGEWASSQWQKVLNIPIKSVDKNYHQTIFEYIEQNVDTITNVSLLGGEPLMQKQNEQLLSMIKPSTHIEIITNLSGSITNNKIYNLLKNHKSITWNISFENVEDRFEYVRYGANWNQLKQNLDTVKDDFGIENIMFLSVYGLWNATRLEEFLGFTNDFGARLGLQPAISKDGLSVFDHSSEIKEMALREIEKIIHYNYHGFTDIKNNLINSPEVPGIADKFLTWTNNNEKLMPPPKSFSELWPELNTVLTKHLP
jgi:sulfatase maturation enzyme AslB (radical SAM superfamily)